MGREQWPDWFRLEHPNMPDHDDAGHELGPGLISLSFASCKACPATTDGRGHHVAFCRVNGCQAAEIRPPGCTGAYGMTRAEWYAQDMAGDGLTKTGGGVRVSDPRRTPRSSAAR